MGDCLERGGLDRFQIKEGGWQKRGGGFNDS